MSKKISELTETIEPTTNDVLPIVNNGETKKSTLSSIINTIKTVLNNVYASITHTHTKSEITDFPSNLSEFNNDSGFISEEGDPTVPDFVKNITEEDIANWNAGGSGGGGITNETDPTVPTHVKNITMENISTWNNKSDFSGNYEDLTNKPTIPEVPTNTSQLNNDSNFISSTVVTNFWSGTQTEYDAITTKNSTTLYLITEE